MTATRDSAPAPTGVESQKSSNKALTTSTQSTASVAAVRRPARYRDAKDHDTFNDVRPTVRHLFGVLCESHPSAAQLKVWGYLVSEIALDIRLWDAVSSYRICEVTGLDRSTVRKALHQLEDLGVIDVQPGRTERKGRREMSVIGFGPGALGPPVPGATSTKHRGSSRSKTGGSTTSHQDAQSIPGGGGSSPPPAGASGARSAEAKFVEAWDQNGRRELIDTAVKRMAMQSGIEYGDLWDLGFLGETNGRLHLNEEVAGQYRPKLDFENFDWEAYKLRCARTTAFVDVLSDVCGAHFEPGCHMDFVDRVADAGELRRLAEQIDGVVTPEALLERLGVVELMTHDATIATTPPSEPTVTPDSQADDDCVWCLEPIGECVC